MSVTELTCQESYRQGVDLVLAGRVADAVRILEPVATDDFPAARLALAKAQLELRNGAAAREQLDALLADEETSVGHRAYLLLLAASAAALEGDQAACEQHLDVSVQSDPRMERAVRALRRAAQRGLPPDVRF